MASAASSASAIAAPRSASSRYTTGATSSAPTRGWRPSWRRRAMGSAAVAAPRASARWRPPGGAASMNTARWWSGSSERCRTSACSANAAWIASRTAASRPSETFGTARRRITPQPPRPSETFGTARRRLPAGVIARRPTGQASGPATGGSRVEHEAPAVEHPRGADGEARVGDEAVEVHRHAHGPADARAGAEGDVDGAKHLLVLEDVARQAGALVRADAELGEVGSLLARVVEEPQPGLPHLPARGGQVPVLDGEPHGLLGEAERRQRRRHHRALAADGRDEALAARQVAERARCREIALVGDAGAAAEVDAQVRSERARDVRLVLAREQIGDAPAARAQQREVAGHQAGEHVLGDAGKRRAARSGLRGGLARAGVREGAAGGRDEDGRGG